jgi:radical SAM superfamily enzyme YgiQ (UPF0313 family)
MKKNKKGIKIIITEPTEEDNTKSVGCWFIENAVRKAGYDIEYSLIHNAVRKKADIYLFSVHHVKDIFHLAKHIDKKQGIWIGGGHVMNNPYPFLHFFDAICVGEGEEWIIEILDLYCKSEADDSFINSSIEISGTLTLQNKDNKITKRYVKDISINDIYLNKSNKKGHKDTWYIEIARGCKSKCAYCELGWTNHYRETNSEKILRQIDDIEVGNKCNRVNIFAPDDLSVSKYDLYLDKIFNKKLLTNFGSMRLERLQELDKKHKKNFLFRIGIDGLSERIRKIVGKTQSNENIIKLIDDMAHKGFMNFKMFFIFSYPFEKETDFHEFVNLIERLKHSVRDLERPILLRIKFTPFIPNPYTPFEDFTPHYDLKMRERIEMFFVHQKINKSNIVISNEGILESWSYYIQTYLARANYNDVNIKLLQNRNKLNFLSTDLAKKVIPNKNIEMYVSRDKLEKAKDVLNKRIKKYEIQTKY